MEKSAPLKILNLADKIVLTINEVFNLNVTGRIFINEMYNKDTYKLFLKVRDVAKKNGYMRPKVKGNYVHVKRNKDSNPIIIRSVKDLKQLKKS